MSSRKDVALLKRVSAQGRHAGKSGNGAIHMPDLVSSQKVIRFGEFEVDLQAGCLFKRELGSNNSKGFRNASRSYGGKSRK